MLNPLEKHCPYPLVYMIANPSRRARKNFSETTHELLARVYATSLNIHSESKAQENVIAIMFALLERKKEFPAIQEVCLVIGQDNVLNCLLTEKFGTNPVINFKIARKLCYWDLPLEKVPVLARYILNLHKREIGSNNFSTSRLFHFLGQPAQDNATERIMLKYAAINTFRWVLYDEHVRGIAFKTKKNQLDLVGHASLKTSYIQDNKLFLEQEEFLFRHTYDAMLGLKGFLYHSREQAERWKSLLS